MKERIQIGDAVKIVKSDYSGINLGDIGIVSTEKYRGFGVDITKIWPSMLSHDKGEKAPTTRTMWFLASYLEKIG